MVKRSQIRRLNHLSLLAHSRLVSRNFFFPGCWYKVKLFGLLLYLSLAIIVAVSFQIPTLKIEITTQRGFHCSFPRSRYHSAHIGSCGWGGEQPQKQQSDGYQQYNSMWCDCRWIEDVCQLVAEQCWHQRSLQIMIGSIGQTPGRVTSQPRHPNPINCHIMNRNTPLSRQTRQWAKCNAAGTSYYLDSTYKSISLFSSAPLKIKDSDIIRHFQLVQLLNEWSSKQTQHTICPLVGCYQACMW